MTGTAYTARPKGCNIAGCGFADAKAVFIGGTHIKADANKKKYENVEADVPIKNCKEQSEAEISADLTARGRKPLKNDDCDGEAPKPEKKRRMENCNKSRVAKRPKRDRNKKKGMKRYGDDIRKQFKEEAKKVRATPHNSF